MIVKLYLITGFLGAGKTSFLKNLIMHCSQKKLYIIINEFGKIGVDATLLSKIDAVVREINNGSIFCSCRLDTFEKVLKGAMEAKPDIILVETSGLSDPIHVERILAKPQFSSIHADSTIEYCGSICIADALRLQSVIETAIVCKNQIGVSSLIIINKCDVASVNQIMQAESLLKKINPLAHIEHTSWGVFKSEWFRYVQPMVALAKTTNSIVDIFTKPDITIQKACISFTQKEQGAIGLEQLESLIKLIVPDTYRIKGFVQIAHRVYLIDCVGPHIEIRIWTELVETDSLNKIVVLAGKGMPLRKALQNAKRWYPHLMEIIE